MALFTTFRNEQKLFTKNTPEDRHLQIGRNQCHRVLFLTDHRVRQEFRQGQTEVESHGLTQFLKGCFCQCEAMIPKVPVGTASESYIGAHCDQFSTWPKRSEEHTSELQ